MPREKEQVLLGARVPAPLKEDLARYCLNHGIKMNYFVAQAIREKLLETAEDAEDLAIAKERLKDPQFVSQSEMDKYLRKRGIKP